MFEKGLRKNFYWEQSFNNNILNFKKFSNTLKIYFKLQYKIFEIILLLIFLQSFS